ncbi:MAG: aminotransferase class IV [Planctomycetes bacterium]|nr:aminotransferase class IV [Planctomycetota bacterium]
MVASVYFDGEFREMADCRVGIEDRGYQFADGVYEVVRFYRKRLFLLDAHLARLGRSAAGIDLPLPLEREEIARILEACVERGGFLHGTVYLQVTRGESPRHHPFPETERPRLIAYARGVPLIPGETLERGVAAVTVPDERWARCDLKTIALLPNILAAERARRAGAKEAIFVGADGRVYEAASSNVLVVIDGTIRTAPESRRILSGTTRTVVLEVAREAGFCVEEEAPPQDALAWASEILLSSTTREVTPCVLLDGSPVGDGRPGPVGRELLRLYRERIRASCGVDALD